MKPKNYADKLKRFLTMALAFVMVFGAMMPLSTERAHAFSGKVGSKYTVHDGGQITYGSGAGGYSNSRKCDLGDGLGSRYTYCVQPAKASPPTGKVTVTAVGQRAYMHALHIFFSETLFFLIVKRTKAASALAA